MTAILTKLCFRCFCCLCLYCLCLFCLCLQCRVLGQGITGQSTTGQSTTGQSTTGQSTATAAAEDRLPRVPPVEPAAAVATFECVPGFEMTLLAAEPLVEDPVAIEYDEFGRAWIAEMRDYPYTDKDSDQPFTERTQDLPLGQIRVLEDLDGDGVFDKSTIFASELSWPTGLAFWKGGVFVVATPELVYLKDTNGDLVADLRVPVVAGFRKFNVQAVINNLKWGDDHWLYGAGSSNGGTLRFPEAASQSPLAMSTGDFRFRPNEPTQFELLAGGARFGNTFDDWDHRFICNIRNPIQHIVLPRSILARNPDAVFPSVVRDVADAGDQIPVWRTSPPEPWRVRNAARLSSSTELASPRSESVATGYMTSASGATVYRGDAYPREFYGSIFLGEVAGNLIHHQVLVRDGVSFRSKRSLERREFVTSTDNWFRPTNFTNAPDGTLHVTDMYRETIEHPWSIPDDIKAELDLESGRDRGRIYRLAPVGFKVPHLIQPGRLDTVELVGLLHHPRGWYRETAHRLIYERQDPTAVPALRELLRTAGEPHAVGRKLALWSLEGLGVLEPADVLFALNDDHPGVRSAAMRLADRFVPGDVTLLDSICERVSDEDPEVRLQLAVVAYSMLENHRSNPEEIAADAVSERGITVLKRLCERSEFRDLGDPCFGAAVLSSASGCEVRLLEQLLKDDIQELKINPAMLRLVSDLSSVSGKRRHTESLRKLSELSMRFEEPSTAATLIRRAITVGVADGIRRGGSDPGSVLGTLPRGSGLNFEEIVTASLDELRSMASQTDSAPQLSDDLRQVWLQQSAALLSLLPFESAAADFGRLLGPSVSDGTVPEGVQLIVVQVCGAQRDPRIPNLLLENYRHQRARVRSQIVESLLTRPEWHGDLLSAIEAGTVAPFDVPHLRRNSLLRSTMPEVKEKAIRIFGQSLAGRNEVVQSYRSQLFSLQGDRVNGEVVYRRECQQCHKAGSEGQELGPNLATIRNRAPDEVLLHILDPNREVAPIYVAQLIVLKDGQQLSGILSDESGSQLTIRMPNGRSEIILREQVEEVISQNQSLMPLGLEQRVTPKEMADLLQFLLQ